MNKTILTLTLLSLFILVGCETELTEIIIGNPDQDCCNGQVRQLTDIEIEAYTKYMDGRNCTPIIEIGKCPCNTSIINIGGTETEFCDCED